MKRRNLVIATILSLSVAMLTACGGKEESKETTSKKAEIESSITVVDKESTEEETTTEDTTTESTTMVVDNETTGEETTTKVDDTSKKETTTKKQETTTAKPTTTQKETTTKQPQTTTKEEQTTKKEEETTTEVWNKTVYEKAAIEVLKDCYSEHIGFMDLNNDNIPELLTCTYYMDESSIYVYKNGKYTLSMTTETFCPWDSKIYMDKSKNILIFGVDNDGLGDYTEDGETFYQYYRFNLINMTTGNNRFLGSIFCIKYEKYYQNCTPYKCHVQPEKTNTSTPGYNGGGYYGPGENEVNKTEFDQFMADVVKDYTFIKNADEIYVSGVTEKSVKEAYKIYSNLGL